MQNVYVTWRCDEDEFYVTPLSIEEGHPALLNSQALVEMAADIEYADTYQEDPSFTNPITRGESYEMIHVFSLPSSIDPRWLY